MAKEKNQVITTENTPETPAEAKPQGNVTRKQVKDYYASGAYNYQQVADHFDIEVEDVVTAIEGAHNPALDNETGLRS